MGSKTHSVPYAARVTYVHPPVDNVPPVFVVDALVDLLDAELTIETIEETIEEAIELYLDAHRRKFSGKHGAPRKAQRLRRFLRYLAANGHSMKLSEMTCEHGQGFITSLANARDGRGLGLYIRKTCQGTLRGISRFLAPARLMTETMFFSLTVDWASKASHVCDFIGDHRAWESTCGWTNRHSSEFAGTTDLGIMKPWGRCRPAIT